jgi:3-oxoacyl-[acyl-carrier protein] reductase
VRRRPAARVRRAVNTKGAFFTLQMAARTVADNGRILYISSGTTGYPMPGYSVHGGSKIAPEYLVEVLAREAVAGGALA